ncbi:MAG: cyclic pyranopterin monophosphate synthase MoaC [Clostridia bacterium]|nr:cyclic pyranopterin monophosphate synthase MoaC [Clostridia bacterium]
MNGLTHFDERGQARMVDVTGKQETHRTAVAEGQIRVSRETMDAIVQGTAKKGDVLGVARVAGIMGVKRTSDLIPMCHPLNIGKVSIDFECDDENCIVHCICTVGLTGQTGVEMEALCGVSTALLTIYDMVKAIDKHMEISGIHLCEKHGGKSGDFFWEDGHG